MPKAIRIHGYGGHEVLRCEDVPAPAPQAGEVVVSVRAMGVNPVDWKIRNGVARAVIDKPFPLVLGADIAGVVETVGAGETRWRPGDEVYGMVGLSGAHAEQIAIAAAALAPKPANLDFVAAASVPLAALTAWQAMVEVANVKPGDRVLVHAAAGGVGGFAVQIAAARGAHVIGTASAGNLQFVRGLGALEALDYAAQPFEDATRDIDVAFDLVGGDTALRSLAVIKAGGLFVSATRLPPPETFAGKDVRVQHVLVKPNGAALQQIGALIEAGRIRTHVSATFPMAEVAKAHARSETSHTRGKIVLTI